MEENEKGQQKLRVTSELPQSKEKVQKVIIGGQLVDQFLKQNRQEKNPPQMLGCLTDENVKAEVIEHKIMHDGIRLSAPQHRFVFDVLYPLLHDYSEKDKKSPNYLRGNIDTPSLQRGHKKTKLATIETSYGDLYRRHAHKPKYTKGDMIAVNNLVQELSSKRHLIRFTSTYKIKENGKIRVLNDYYEYTGTIITSIATHKRDETSDNTTIQTIDRLILTFDEIIIADIAGKYIVAPRDLHQRMLKACGGKGNSVTVSAYNFAYYLMRELSSKRYEVKLGSKKLISYLGLDSYLKEGRRSLIKKAIDKTISIAREIGLLIDYSVIDGIEEPVYIFQINKNWP